jgi:hypothetical protein
MPSSGSKRVDEWFQSLAVDEQDALRASTHSADSPFYFNRNGTTPGGAIVMDHVIRHGMWAPVETRLFHHIISVRQHAARVLNHFFTSICDLVVPSSMVCSGDAACRWLAASLRDPVTCRACVYVLVLFEFCRRKQRALRLNRLLLMSG